MRIICYGVHNYFYQSDSTFKMDRRAVREQLNRDALSPHEPPRKSKAREAPMMVLSEGVSSDATRLLQEIERKPAILLPEPAMIATREEKKKRRARRYKTTVPLERKKNPPNFIPMRNSLGEITNKNVINQKRNSKEKASDIFTSELRRLLDVLVDEGTSCDSTIVNRQRNRKCPPPLPVRVKTPAGGNIVTICQSKNTKISKATQPLQKRSHDFVQLTGCPAQLSASSPYIQLDNRSTSQELAHLMRVRTPLLGNRRSIAKKVPKASIATGRSISTIISSGNYWGRSILAPFAMSSLANL